MITKYFKYSIGAMAICGALIVTGCSHEATVPPPASAQQMQNNAANTPPAVQAIQAQHAQESGPPARPASRPAPSQP